MFQPAPHIANVRYAIRNIAAEAARVEAQGHEVLHCNIGDPLTIKTDSSAIESHRCAQIASIRRMLPSPNVSWL